MVLCSILFNENTTVSFSTCCWWAFGLLPVPCYYEQCYSGTSVSLLIPMHRSFSRGTGSAVKWLLQRVGASSISLSCFSKMVLSSVYETVPFGPCPQEHMVLSNFHFSQFGGWQRVCHAFNLHFLIIAIKHISICLLVVSFPFCKIPIHVYFLLSFLLTHRTALYMNSISVYLCIYWCIYLSKTIFSNLTSFNKNNNLRCIKP